MESCQMFATAACTSALSQEDVHLLFKKIKIKKRGEASRGSFSCVSVGISIPDGP